jgi:uncharacterized membrane protein
MPMSHELSPPRRYPRLRLQTLLLAVVGAGIVHIGMTFAWPYLATGNAVRRIAAVLPADGLKPLPPVSPKTQTVAFQSPDIRHAACKFNVSEAAYVVRATLPEAGWTFSVHSASGDSVYVVTGQDQRRTEIAVLVLPPGDRFVGVLPEARLAAGFAQVSMPSAEGIVLIRAPNKGAAYQAQVDAELAKATCTPRRT